MIKSIELVEAFISFGLVALLIPVFKTFVKKQGILEEPNERKIHDKPIPTLGGIIFISVGLILSLLLTDYLTYHLGTLIGIILILALGVLDDLEVFSSMTALKPILTLTAAAFPVFLDGVDIPYLFSPISGNIVDIGPFSVVLAIFFVFSMVNAINFLDGADGLAGGISVISLGFFAYLALATSQLNLLPVALLFSGSVLGFLLYNYKPASIFMGDTGALSLGFILSFFAIELTYPLSESSVISLTTPVYVLALPIMDTVYVVISRIIQGKNIFHPDKEHLHYFLMDKGLSERCTTNVLYLFVVIMGCLGLLLSSYSLVLQFWVFTGIFLFISGIRVLTSLSPRLFRRTR